MIIDLNFIEGNKSEPMKELQDMSLAELWELFPIILREHDPRYKAWYEEERADLMSLLKNQEICRISHIGSTAVPGLVAKPIVDILLELQSGFNAVKINAMLQSGGWILMSSGQEDALDLNKGYTPNGFAEKVFHLHIRHSGDWGELYFRDYLCKHPDVARQYEKLKFGLKERFMHDRDAYTAAKSEFVQTYTEAAREEFKKRYLPNKSI